MFFHKLRPAPSTAPKPKLGLSSCYSSTVGSSRLALASPANAEHHIRPALPRDGDGPTTTAFSELLTVVVELAELSAQAPGSCGPGGLRAQRAESRFAHDLL